MNVAIQYSYVILLMAFILYRKIKRTIGFQLYKPRRLIVRIILFSLLSLMIILSGFNHPSTFVFDGIGILLGCLLLSYAIKHSMFKIQDDSFYYRTHLWIESIVIVLFFSRFFYRFLTLFQLSQHTDQNTAFQFSQYFTKDPATIIIFFILMVYYIGFHIYIYKKGKHSNLSIPTISDDKKI